MTNVEYAMQELERYYERGVIPTEEAMQIAIQTLQRVGYLADRPCAVCKCHGDDGCKKWSCVFDEIWRHRTNDEGRSK